MKKLLLLSAFFIGAFGFSQTWTQQNTNYVTAGSYTGEVSVVDSNIAWSLVQRTTATNYQQFSKTTDGGTTWTTGTINVGNATGLSIANITAVDANTAWVSVFPTSAALATQGIYKTINGGTTWTKQTTAAYTAPSFCNFVYFWDANNGVCMGDKLGNYYEIYTTSNGGTTWTRTSLFNIATSTGDFGYTGSFCVRGNTIWFGTDAGELMRSTNFGLNWTKITTPVLDFGGGTVTTQRAIYAFKDDTNGIIIKNNIDATNAVTSSVFYRSTNGGTSWTTVSTTGFYNGAIDYAGTGMLVTGGSSGSSAAGFGSAYSLNDGTTWINIDGIGKTSLNFLNASVGYGGGFTDANDSAVGGIYKFNNALGTTNFVNNKFTTYPNPANTFVNISNNDNILISNIEITDLNGRIIKSVKIGNLNETQINVSDLNSGVYFMNISSDSGRAIKKFVKN